MANSHRAGAKRKSPNSAIMKLVYDHGMSSYSVHKKCGMSAGQLFNASKEDITHLSLKFFLRLAYALDMPVTDVISQLMKLQQLYPPQMQSRKAFLHPKKDNSDKLDKNN